MSEQEAFADFLRRLRAGDEQAAADLVRRYEGVIRREARLQMTDPRLGRLFDSVDISQSVLASFFARAAAGQYDLDRSEDLVRLLVRMAHNKVASQARRQKARPADRRRVDGAALATTLMEGADPGHLAAGRDLLAEVRRRLSADERQVAELRSQGRSWPEVAAELGGNPDSRRMQLARALDRVTRALGLEDEDNELR
jgi:DNA-directed RNA polymerase specialized sigma24 family protein